MTPVEEYQALLKEKRDIEKRIHELKAKAKHVGRDAFIEQAKPLFEANPKLTSFGWTQYTPYWNDGDTCYFSAHYEEPLINGEYSYEKHDDLTEEELDDLANKVCGFISQYDDVLEDVFGDHAEITVSYKDGKVDVCVDQCSHD